MNATLSIEMNGLSKHEKNCLVIVKESSKLLKSLNFIEFSYKYLIDILEIT
jgi:hypothetical protein